MDNTIYGHWFPFGKPIKYRQGFDEGWLLAWRLFYEEQRKAFEPLEIGGIEYLDSNGEIIFSEDMELADNFGGEL